MRVLTAAVAVIGLFTATACSGDPTEPTDRASDNPQPSESCPPQDGCGAWERVEPAEAGFDASVLEDLAAEAEAEESTCLAVVRNGKLVAEWNWLDSKPSTTADVYSATKSVASMLIGIAQDEGKLDIDDKVAEYIPAWAGTDAAEVTIRHILGNESGRHWSKSDDYLGLVTAGDRTQYAIDTSQDAEPGTTWAYNNTAIQALDAVLEEATGQKPAAYAEKRLFGPLGMADSAMTKDLAGNTNLFAGLNSSCEDMARFGQLLLREGEWGGERIVSKDWITTATGESSQDFNAAYGYLWWLNDRGTVIGPNDAAAGRLDQARPDSRLVPDAPDDMYWAIGLGGQVLQIDPGSDTVVVRLAPVKTDVGYGPGNTAKIVTQALE